MNKKLLSLILVLFSFIGVILTTQTTYAAHTAGITLSKEIVSGQDRYYVKNNGLKYFIPESTVYIDFNVAGIYNITSMTVVFEDSDKNQSVEVPYSGLIIQDLYYGFFIDGKELELEINGESIYTIIDWFVERESTVSLYFKDIVSLDNVRPAISGQETFVVSIDDPKTPQFFQSYLTAVDETDGNITSRITVKTDNYTPNKNVIGTYQITYSVKDNANNESTLVVNVQVVDVTKPVITGNTSVANISYTQTWNITSFKSTLTVTDNVDTLNHSNIVVETDGYTSNKTNLGTYNVVYAVTDTAGNKATFTKQVKVIDDIAPVFSGPATITKPNNSILTVNDIKAQLTAVDAKEGAKTANITVKTDNYTGKGNITGTYTIVFEVKDSVGNTATHTVTVEVSDKIPPVWYIQDGVSVKLIAPATLTRQQILDLLTATGQLTINSTTQINFIIDEYTGNEEVPGVYQITLGYQDVSGNSGVANLELSVLEQEDTNPIVVTPDRTPSQEFFDKLFENPVAALVIALGGVILIGLVVIVFTGKRR